MSLELKTNKSLDENRNSVRQKSISVENSDQGRSSIKRPQIFRLGSFY